MPNSHTKEYANNNGFGLSESIPLNNPLINYFDTDLLVVSKKEIDTTFTLNFINKSIENLYDSGIENHHASFKHGWDFSYLIDNYARLYSNSSKLIPVPNTNKIKGFSRYALYSSFFDGSVYFPENVWYLYQREYCYVASENKLALDLLLPENTNTKSEVYRQIPCKYQAVIIFPNVVEEISNTGSNEDIKDAKMLNYLFGKVLYPRIVTAYINRTVVINGKSKVLRLSPEELIKVWYDSFLL